MNQDTSLTIERDSATPGWRLESSQWLPQPRDRVFEFFSDAFQLETLTPDFLSSAQSR